MNPKRKIQLGLFLGLVLLASLLIFKNRFAAFGEPTYTIVGTLFSSETKKPISGAKVMLFGENLHEPLTTSTYNYYGFDGYYRLTVPVNLSSGKIAFQKDGFYDAELYFNFPNPSGWTMSVSTALKTGFGKEEGAIYRLRKGFYPVSFPFDTNQVYPNELLQYQYGTAGNASYNTESILANYPKYKIKLYSQEGIYGSIVPFDPNNPSSLKIEQGKSYYLSNEADRSYFLVIKGRPLRTELAMDLTPPVKGLDFIAPFVPTAIGNPALEQISTSELEIIDTKDANKIYSLEEAVTNNFLDKYLKVKTGLSSESSLDIGSQPQILEPAKGYLLTAKKGGLKLKFKNQKPGNFVEIPEGITAQEAEWAFWTDSEELSGDNLAIWEDLLAEMEQALPTGFSPSGPAEEEISRDINLVYTKNNKPISGKPKENVPPVPQKTPSNNNRRITQACKQIKQLKLCWQYKVGSQPTLPWDEATMNELTEQTEESYDLMEGYFGPVLLNDGVEKSKGYKLIHLLNKTDIDNVYAVASTVRGENTIRYYKGFLELLHDDKILTHLHELLHMWRDEKSPSLGFWPFSGLEGPSWEEGQVEFIEKRIAIARGFYSIGLLDYRNVETDYYEQNQPMLVSWNGDAWFSRPGAATYLLAAVAWSKIYSENQNVFKEFNQKLNQEIEPWTALKSVLPHNLPGNPKIPTVGAESIDEWYKKQWGGLTQNYPNRYPGYRLYRGAFHASPLSRAGQFLRAIKVKGLYGKHDFLKNSYFWGLYKSMGTVGGKTQKDQLILSGVDGIAAQWEKVFSIVGYENGILESGKKYTLTDFRIETNVKKIPPSRVYLAAPKANACIYGVVAERNDFEVTIQRLLPNPGNSPKVFQGTYGYFDVNSSNPDYGCAAGTYKISYKTICGSTRQYYLIKPATTDFEGRLFLPIRTGKATLSVSKNDPVKSIREALKDIIGFKAEAGDEDICYPDELKIDAESIKKERLLSGEVKVTFKTTRPAISYAEWGESQSYGQNSEMSREAALDHEIIFKPVSTGQTYHFKIYAVDATGKTAAAGEAASPDEEDFLPTLSTETPDQTFTPILVEMASLQISNLTSNSVTVSWSTIPAASAVLEYGPDTNYANQVEINQMSSAQSVNLTGLNPNTTYYLRIRALTDPTNFAYDGANLSLTTLP